MLKLKKIKPMFAALVTTMDKYTGEETLASGLIDATKIGGTVKEYQKVIAVGPHVNGIKEGDLVCVNPTRFMVRKQKPNSIKDNIESYNSVVTYNFDVIELNGEQCLLLQDRDIDFVIEDYEEVEDPTPSPLYKPDNKLIV